MDAILILSTHVRCHFFWHYFQAIICLVSQPRAEYFRDELQNKSRLCLMADDHKISIIPQGKVYTKYSRQTSHHHSSVSRSACTAFSNIQIRPLA